MKWAKHAFADFLNSWAFCLTSSEAFLSTDCHAPRCDERLKKYSRTLFDNSYKSCAHTSNEDKRMKLVYEWVPCNVREGHKWKKGANESASNHVSLMDLPPASPFGYLKRLSRWVVPHRELKQQQHAWKCKELRRQLVQQVRQEERIGVITIYSYDPCIRKQKLFRLLLCNEIDTRRHYEGYKHKVRHLPEQQPHFVWAKLTQIVKHRLKLIANYNEHAQK